MLRSLRDGAKHGFLKYILLGFLVLAGGGLVLTDVGGFFRGGVAADDVAKIGELKISAREFDRNVRRYLAQQGVGPEAAYRYGIIDQLLESEINARLLTINSHELGLKVSDEQLKHELMELTEVMAQSEESRKLALQRILQQQGISEKEFLRSLRQETSNSLFKNALLGGTGIVPRIMTSILYQYENETRDAGGIILTNDQIKDVEQPTEEQLQSYYEATKASFLIPETRTITIATLNEEMVKDRIEITDEELQQDYEANIESFTVPERRLIEQTVASNEEQATKILAEMESGKTLREATKAVTGDESAYQALDEFEQSGLLEDVAQPVFTAKINEPVGPVETPLGWHVLQVTKIIAPESIPFDQVKDDLKNDLLSSRLTDVLMDTANEMDDRLAGGEELETIVADMGLTTEKIGPMKETGVTPDDKKDDLLKSYQQDRVDILDTAFSFDAGETAPVMELQDGNYIAVRVDSVTPQSYEEYDSVKDELAKQWIDQQKSLTNQAQAQDLLAEIKDGLDFGEAAKKAGVSIKTYKDVKRRDPGDTKLPIQALDQLFALPEGETLLSPYNDGYILLNVSAVNLPDFAKADAEGISTIEESLLRVLPTEAFNQYMNVLNQKEKVKINRRLLDQMYGVNNEGS